MKAMELLFIDDHPMILKGYKSTLERCKKYDIKVHTKTSIEDAYSYIVEENEKDKFDIIFYDISMPESEKYNIRNGVDLAIKVKQKIQHPKTVFLTMISDFFQIENILLNVKPEGILIKNDITKEALILAIVEVMTSPPSYSRSILSITKRPLGPRQSIDKVDQNILYHISKGLNTKEISNTVFLSISTIEKRKKRIKELFEIEQKSDLGLIDEGKKRGFL